jgi:hypothetical protein
MIIVVYNLVASLGAPAIYNYWAILGLDIFAVIFWLISFALLASETAGWSIVTYYYDDCDYYYGYCVKKRDIAALSKRATTNLYTYRNSMAACSGFGGLELYVLSPHYLPLLPTRSQIIANSLTPPAYSS